MYPEKSRPRNEILSALVAILAGVTLILFGKSSWGLPLLGAVFGFILAGCVRWWQSRSRTSRE